jgi:hypothetical protein
LDNRRRRWHLLFPSLRRLYLTWYREKYASFLTSLDFSQSQRFALQTRIRSNSQRLSSTLGRSGEILILRFLGGSQSEGHLRKAF